MQKNNNFDRYNFDTVKNLLQAPAKKQILTKPPTPGEKMN